MGFPGAAQRAWSPELTAQLSLWVGTVQGDQSEAQPRPPGLSRLAWEAMEGFGDDGQVRLLPSISREPRPRPGPWPAPHCGGSTHRDRPLGQRKRPLPSGPIRAFISRGLSAAGFLAWVIKMDRGRAPSALPSATVTASGVSTTPGTTMAREKPNIPAEPWVLGSRIAQSGGPGRD